jgi:hypothetical protein
MEPADQVHQAVDPAEQVDRVRHRLPGADRIGHVRGERAYLLAVVFGRDRRQPVGVASGEHKPVPGGGELARHVRTDRAGGTADDQNLPVAHRCAASPARTAT